MNPESDLAAGVLIYAKRRAETAEVIQCALESLQIIELHDFSDRIRETKGCPLTLLLPDAVAAMYFTSGMTGKPRCVMLAHRNIGSREKRCDFKYIQTFCNKQFLRSVTEGVYARLL